MELIKLRAHGSSALAQIIRNSIDPEFVAATEFFRKAGLQSATTLVVGLCTLYTSDIHLEQREERFITDPRS